MVHNFCIGGFGLCIKNGRSADPFKSAHFPLFRVKSSGRRAIEWNFHRLDRAILQRPYILPEDVPVVPECLHWGSATPLFGAPGFRRRLAVIRDRKNRIAIECHPNAVTVLDFGSCRGDVFFVEPRRKAKDDAREKYILGAGLLAPFLPARGAFLLHAAAVADDNGKAALFLAPDEGGKTSAVRLADAGTGTAHVIGDDQVILRRERGGFWVHGTPWNLISAGPIKARPGGIFLLEKSKRFRLTLLKAAAAIGAVWNEHRNVTDFIPGELRKKAFSLVTDACSSAPVYRLEFSGDRLDWPAVAACLLK